MPDVELKYTEHDLKLFGELEGIKVLQSTILDKLEGYCTTNDKQHEAMWRKIDTHSKKINWILGIGTGITLALGYVWNWITTKVGK